MPPTVRPTIPPPPGLIRRLDARIKLVLLVAACFVTQYLPDFLLPPWLIVLCGLFLAREMRTAGVRIMLRGGFYFTLFWLIMKTGSDVFVGMPFARALSAALPLAGRLAALTVVGMAFVGLSTPVETARAVAWYLSLPELLLALAARGLARIGLLSPMAATRAVAWRRESRVWKPALVIALTAWFLPVTLRLVGEVLAAARARGLRLSWRKKAAAVTGTALRILQRQADELAVGLASRRLDDYRSWHYEA